MTLNGYKREYKRRKRIRMIKQRLLGVLAIILGVIICYIASKGMTAIERDATPAIFMYLLGFSALFSRQCFIF